MPPLIILTALMAPEEPLHEDAQVAYLVGKQPDQAGVWRELYVYRARRMVHVYRIESHGRRFYRSLEYCSDARYCLRDMQPSTAHREGMWPEWERHGAGHPYGDSHNQTKSAVITRDWMVEANLSLGRETYLPSRLLYGLVPQALLDTHAFWQDEDDHVRGSPRGVAPPHASAHHGARPPLSPHRCAATHGTCRAARASSSSSSSRALTSPSTALASIACVRRPCRTCDCVRVPSVPTCPVWPLNIAPDCLPHQVRPGDHALPPARACILRLKAARLTRQRDAVLGALKTLERFVRDEELIVGPFEPTHQVCRALGQLLSRQGHPAFRKAAANATQGNGPGAVPGRTPSTAPSGSALGGAAGDTSARHQATPRQATSSSSSSTTTSAVIAASAAELAPFRALLELLDLSGFRRRRRRHRISAVVLPMLLDSLAALMAKADEERAAAAGMVAAAAASPASPASDATVATPSSAAPSVSSVSSGPSVSSVSSGVAPAAPDLERSRAMSASDLEDEELVLLDLLHAPADSYLYSLATVMARIETLSQVR